MNQKVKNLKHIFLSSVPPSVVFFSIVVFLYVPLWFTTIHMARTYQAGQSQGSLPVLGSDSEEYRALAENLISQHCFTLTSCNNSEIFRTPGYSFFVAVVVHVFGSYFIVTLLQIGLVCMGAFMLYRVALLYIESRYALYAGVMFLLEPSVVFHSLVILSDTVYTFLLILVLYVCVTKKPSLYTVITVSFLVGLSVYVRPISLYILPLFLILYSVHHVLNWRKCFTVFGVGLVVYGCTVGPWMYRNYIHTKQITFSSITTYNLFYYNIPLFISYTTGDTEEKVRERLFVEADVRPSEAFRQDSLLRMSPIVVTYMKNNLVRYTLFHFKTTTSFFFGSSVKNAYFSYYRFFNESVSFKEVTSSFFDVIVLCERITWLLLYVILYVPLFTKKYKSIGLFCVTMVIYFAVLTGPVSYVRYRLPALPFIFLGCVIGFMLLRKQVFNTLRDWCARFPCKNF